MNNLTVEEIIDRSIKWGKEGTWFSIYLGPFYTKIIGQEVLIYQKRYFLRAPDKKYDILYFSKTGREIHKES